MNWKDSGVVTIMADGVITVVGLDNVLAGELLQLNGSAGVVQGLALSWISRFLPGKLCHCVSSRYTVLMNHQRSVVDSSFSYNIVLSFVCLSWPTPEERIHYWLMLFTSKVFMAFLCVAVPYVFYRIVKFNWTLIQDKSFTIFWAYRVRSILLTWFDSSRTGSVLVIWVLGYWAGYFSWIDWGICAILLVYSAVGLSVFFTEYIPSGDKKVWFLGIWQYFGVAILWYYGITIFPQRLLHKAMLVEMPPTVKDEVISGGSRFLCIFVLINLVDFVWMKPWHPNNTNIGPVPDGNDLLALVRRLFIKPVEKRHVTAARAIHVGYADTSKAIAVVGQHYPSVGGIVAGVGTYFSLTKVQPGLGIPSIYQGVAGHGSNLSGAPTNSQSGILGLDGQPLQKSGPNVKQQLHQHNAQLVLEHARKIPLPVGTRGVAVAVEFVKIATALQLIREVNSTVASTVDLHTKAGTLSVDSAKGNSSYCK